MTVSAILLAFAVAGCDSKGDTPAPATSKSGPAAASTPAKPSTSAATTAAPATGGKGLAAAGNDAAVVDLAKKAITCKQDDWGNFGTDCADYKAWEDSKLFEDGKADATLVNFIEDSDDKVRTLAYTKLYYGSHTKTFEDKGLTDRILTAAENEKGEKLIEKAGNIAGRVDVTATGAFDRIKKLFASGPKPMKLALTSMVVASGNNYKNEDVWAWHKGLLQDADGDIRKKAMQTYWGTPSNMRGKDVCAIRAENFGHTDVLVAALACAHSSGTQNCIDDLDKAIAEVDKRHKAGQITDKATDFLDVLGDPWKNAKVTDAQKKKKVEIAKSLATDTKLPDNIRRGALERVFQGDPAAGKALAQTLLSDKAIGTYAKTIVDKK
jgi:hypothetical protein